MKISDVANPKQVILVTSRAEVKTKFSPETETKDNIFTLAWHMQVSNDPPLFAISSGKPRYSTKLIQESRAFVVNFMPFKLKEEVLFCGRNSGEHIDKFKETGLEKEEADTIDCTRIKQASGYLECRVVNEVDAGDHIIFIGEVIKMDLKKQGKRIFQKQEIISQQLNKMKELNVAIIGAGILGEVHAKAYKNHGKSKLLWIVDLNAKRAKALAKKFKCKATTNLNDVLKDKKVNAVSVVTPDFAHKDIVIRSLKAGKHVLCEKPLATNTKDAKAMVDQAKKHKLNLMVDFQNRWNPLFLETKKQIKSGALGNLVCGYARLSNTYFVPTKMLAWAGKSGPEWFLLPHIFDLVRWMTGRKKIVEVFARAQKKILKSKGINAFDAVQTSIKFKDGSFFTFENSWVLPEGSSTLIDFKMTLLGSKGKIEINGDNQGIAITDSKKINTPFILAEQNAFGKTTGFFQLPVLHFVDSLLAGKSPEAPGEDGLAATIVVEAAVKSIKTGKPIKVKI